VSEPVELAAKLALLATSRPFGGLQSTIGHIEHNNHNAVMRHDLRPEGGSALRRRRDRFVAVCALALLPASVLLSGPGSSVASTPSSKPYPAKDVTLVGHGWGPAWGLGQWGAFGYAAKYHEDYQWILLHYYPGTTASVLSKGADRRIVKVSIEENAGHPVTVTSHSSFSVKSGSTKLSIPAGMAVRSVLSGSGTSKGTWSVSEAGSCKDRSGWKVLARGLTDPIDVPASSSAKAPASKLLQLCRADGVVVTYRGSIEAYDYDSSSTGYRPYERTLSLVPLEQYVEDVTPTESPSGWGQLPNGSAGPQGEPYGFQELEAQAVAVRTYVLAQIAGGGWYGYADICDNVCQGYSLGTYWENPLTDLATNDTKGQVLELAGSPAPTQYAASSGGYTQGSPSFAPVADSGDAVCLKDSGGLGCNPWHTWTASVPVSEVEQAFPGVGTLADVKVTARNKLGALGGRVLEIEVIGTTGETEKATGNTWAADFGLYSNWFALTNGPSATAKPPSEKTPGAFTPGGRSAADGPTPWPEENAGVGLPGAMPPVPPISARPRGARELLVPR
jgi:peptidoglycan hydrolase-like amidase